MTTELTIGTTTDGAPFTLPVGAVTQKFALFAQSGAGKSYAAMKLAEELLSIGAQIIALDPVGIWWGLRVAADGEGPGFPIAVFGGDYGDLPLPAGSGALVADLLVDQRIAAVLDVSAFELPEQRRFIAAFAERFFQRKKRSRSPVHLFLEEAQTFAPLRPEKDETVMLNRVERMARLGRNYGIGWTLISQRPQEVHTKVRNQAGTLIALRTIGPHERKAVAEWMDDNATTPADLDLVNELPTLATGTAHIYSPSFLKVSMRVQFGRRRTFDSSATPEDGVIAVEPRALAAVDVAALRTALEEAGALREQDDPTALRRRIAELEQHLRERPPATVERVEIPVLDPGQVARLVESTDQLHQLGQALMAQAETLADQLQQVSRPPQPPDPQPTTDNRLLTTNNQQPTTDNQPSTTDLPDERLPGGQQQILDALATFEALGVRVVDRANVAAWAGQSPTSGSYSAHVSTLRDLGLIRYPQPRHLSLTDAGRARARRQATLRTLADLHAAWCARLPERQAMMLRDLIERYPESVDRDELAVLTDQSPTSGSFSAHVSALKGLGVVAYPERRRVAATALLFPDLKEGG